jgi:hypothetical protein
MLQVTALSHSIGVMLFSTQAVPHVHLYRLRLVGCISVAKHLTNIL